MMTVVSTCIGLLMLASITGLILFAHTKRDSAPATPEGTIPTATGLLASRVAQMAHQNNGLIVRNTDEKWVIDRRLVSGEAYVFELGEVHLEGWRMVNRRLPDGRIAYRYGSKLTIDDEKIIMRPEDTTALVNALVDAFDNAENLRNVEKRRDQDLKALDKLGKIL